MQELYTQIANLIQSGQSGVLTTIIQVQGSVPRHSGSKMLVHQDSSITGTIGGGRLEADVIQDALQWIDSNSIHQKTYNLTKDEGMLCGGTVDVLFEPIGNPSNLIIFGAGHIAEQLSSLAHKANFRVTIIDDRPEFANTERFPDADSVIAQLYTQVIESLPFTDKTFVVIVTHAHKYDQEILEYCLTHPFAYLGMIGSKRKSRTVLDNLRKKGSPEEKLAEVHTPVGLDIGAETPFEIAISILSEMIGVRHGIDVTTRAMPK